MSFINIFRAEPLLFYTSVVTAVGIYLISFIPSIPFFMWKALLAYALYKAAAPVVVTPHLGEMAKLTGKTIFCIRKHRKDAAREFAASYNVIVVLKGSEDAPTVVAYPQGELFVNSVGNRTMATAGMGVLTGIIAGFIA